MTGCEMYKMMLHRALDGEMLSDDERAQMTAHEAQCAACRREGALLTQMQTQFQTLDDAVEAPEAFSQGWRKAVRMEASRKRKKPYRALVGAAACVLAVALGGASMMEQRPFENGTNAMQMKTSRTSVTMDYQMAGNGAMMDAAVYEEAAEAETAAVKRIKSASIDLRTADFDGVVEQLRTLSAQFGGYVGNENLYGVAGEEARNAYLNVFVEAGELDAFLTQAVELGELKARSMSVQDVTDAYTDTSGRLESAKARRDRLNELVAQAQDIGELIELEDALSDVQRTIESHERTLQDWDKRVAYASVSVSVEEKRSEDAVREGDMGLLARMRSAVADSMEWMAEFAQGMLVFVTAMLPFAMVAGVVALFGWASYKICKKHSKKKTPDQ